MTGLRSRVIVAHNRVGADADPSTADVMAQVGLVSGALSSFGIPFETVAVDESRIWEVVRPAADAVVFNLVEAPPGRPGLQPASAAVLEILGVPFTGSPPSILWLTTDKIATRALLASAGIPVAPGGRLDLDDPRVLTDVPPPWLLKPAWEDASVGLDGDPVCSSRERALARGAELSRRFPGQPVLIEHFLPGRELNVSLLADGDAVEVLPVAEIAFVDFPPGAMPLVSYEAKWHEGSFEDTHTIRRFPPEEEDGPLLERVRSIARAAWRTTGLVGYGRVDIRLDENGEPRVLEVNANPCIAPDAGFTAAAARAGYPPAVFVGRILAAAGRVAG